jgi:hypothetical protein
MPANVVFLILKAQGRIYVGMSMQPPAHSLAQALLNLSPGLLVAFHECLVQ